MWEPIVAAIATFLIGLVAGHKYWIRAIRSVKEFHDVVGAVLEAVEDEKITPEEAKKIAKEAKEFANALKGK